MKIKKLYPDALVPMRGSAEATGLDLCAYIRNDDRASYGMLDIAPNETVKIGTGIATEIPKGCFGAIFARSGLATKFGLRPANCVGVIDCDYTGEIIVALHNDSDSYRTITNGERIAQLVIVPYLPVDIEITDELCETQRGDGGFGSTGRYTDNNNTDAKLVRTNLNTYKKSVT